MKVHFQSMFVGFVAGAATATVVPVVLPALTEALRPAAKVLLKQGVLAMERARLTVARATESVEDLIAEVRAEVEAQLARAGGGEPQQARVVDVTAAQARRTSSHLVS